MNVLRIGLQATAFALISAIGVFSQQSESPATPADNRHAITRPAEGKLSNDKPVGKHWVNMLKSLDGWNADSRYWKLSDGVLHGDYDGGKLHNYSWTKKTYKDFELNVVIRMTGKNANSGVCIRLHPTDADAMRHAV